MNGITVAEGVSVLAQLAQLVATASAAGTTIDPDAWAKASAIEKADLAQLDADIAAAKKGA